MILAKSPWLTTSPYFTPCRIVGRGTCLRRKIHEYQLDKVVRHGRIWRLSYDGIERDRTQPRMLNETPGNSSSI